MIRVAAGAGSRIGAPPDGPPWRWKPRASSGTFFYVVDCLVTQVNEDMKLDRRRKAPCHKHSSIPVQFLTLKPCSELSNNSFIPELR